MLNKYPHRKSVQLLHVIEAWIIVLSIWMSGRNYNTRKSNHSRRNTTNEILNKMGRIKEERICEYLLFKIQEGNLSLFNSIENDKDNKYEDDGLNVYEKFTPTTLSLALYFKLCDKHWGKENWFNVPQIISEYSNFNSLSLNELRVCKAIIDKQIDHKDNRAFMKNTLKILVSKIDNSVEKIYKSQANSEQPEMNQDEPNFYSEFIFNNFRHGWLLEWSKQQIEAHFRIHFKNWDL